MPPTPTQPSLIKIINTSFKDSLIILKILLNLIYILIDFLKRYDQMTKRLVL